MTLTTLTPHVRPVRPAQLRDLLAYVYQAHVTREEEGKAGQMQPSNRPALYEERLVSLWERLATTLGVHTARILLDRAIWQTAQRHPEIALIHHDSGLSFDALQTSYATWLEEENKAAFNELAAEILLILDRLLGREMAERMCRVC